VARFAVAVEQAEDGGWSAYSDVSGSIIGGLGDTREAAIEDWKVAMTAWLKYMADNGYEVVIPDVELVSVEVPG
jgi:predicted RNase H-like HicB family nuclease